MYNALTYLVKLSSTVWYRGHLHPRYASEIPSSKSIGPHYVSAFENCPVL